MSSLLESDLGSTLHDRERRQQRGKKKIDLLRARRYGMCEPGKKGRLKYTLAGTVFIWDPQKNKAVTCWGNPKSSIKSGTRFTDPILLQKSSNHELPSLLLERKMIVEKIQKDTHHWKSHTVFVVDMSGSMRTDDVDGSRCRSDGVWTCLARDFVKKQLEANATTMFDLVSVVVMRETAETIIMAEPTDWVLHNKLVDLREWTTLRPEGPGNYKPALQRAEELLKLNDLGSCAPSLFFFSDGKPSDSIKLDIASRMGGIASRFGRRLSLCCVGMASAKEDFSVLQDMVGEAKAFGAAASFNRPSLNADSLSNIISSHVSSLTSTKTELTELKTGETMRVRTDLVRERIDAPDDITPTDDWRIFPATSNEQYTRNVWKWHSKKGIFCYVLDPRCASCYKVVADENHNITNGGTLCRGCKACFFCARCVVTRRTLSHSQRECLVLADKRRKGMIQKERVTSFGVAWKKSLFGEGAERVAFKFRFLDENNNFIGPKMVAKESRFVARESQKEFGDASDYLRSHQHEYHLLFVRTQALAAKFAHLYNRELNQLASNVTGHNLVMMRSFPRIRFLQPLVFELNDEIESKNYNVLVEPMIEGDYKKYNDNFGAIPKIQETESSHGGLDASTVNLLLGKKDVDEEKKTNFDTGGLGAILEEGSEDDDDDHSEEGEPYLPTGADAKVIGDGDEFFDSFFMDGELETRRFLPSKGIPDKEFPNAFSHFSYVRSGGRLMVVDLQGCLDSKPDGTKEFVFTDPAVHKRRKDKRLRHLKFGRTDRGKKGIDAFFASHVCGDACRLLGVRPKISKRSSSAREDKSKAFEPSPLTR